MHLLHKQYANVCECIYVYMYMHAFAHVHVYVYLYTHVYKQTQEHKYWMCVKHNVCVQLTAEA